MRTLLLLVLTVVYPMMLMAQVPRPTGLLEEDELYQSVPHLPPYSGSKFDETPIRVDLKKYCPRPGDQGMSSSCVGWAAGYGALTILRAMKGNLSDVETITSLANSAAYIYNQIKQEGDCQAGASLIDAMELMEQEGDCLDKSFGTGSVDCTTKPDGDQRREAEFFKIEDYAAVFELRDAPKIKVDKVRKMLAKDNPVIIGMKIGESFWSIKAGDKIWNPADTEVVETNHAMVVTGYDDVEKRFELLNSFGSVWGNSGFIYVDYEDFGRLCRYALIMLIDEQTLVQPENSTIADQGQPPVLAGEFVFRQPIGYATNNKGEEILVHEELETVFNATEGYYQLASGSRQTGELFQLVARNIPKGNYLYVFSRSPSGEVTLHFPKFDQSGKPVADFIPSSDAEIVIPSQSSVLRLSETGQDFLCVLYSNRKLADIQSRIQQLKNTSRSFPEEVRNLFGDLLASPASIQYQSSFMNVKGYAGDKEAVAISIILLVEAEN